MNKATKTPIMLMIGLMSVLCGQSKTALAWYNPPKYSKVTVVRNPKGQSYLELKFHWSSEAPPNFGSGTAVEFEIHVDNKCFVQPIGGKDDNHNCRDSLGGNAFYLPNGSIGDSQNTPNCYVDVWNYWAPGSLSIVDETQKRCGYLTNEAKNCLSVLSAAGKIVDPEANFAVGLHQANKLVAGKTYWFRYPVEINNTPECMGEYGSWIDEGLAWVNMQTFKNTCQIEWYCNAPEFYVSTPFIYSCPELIGADPGCKNANKENQLWLNNLCVPTGQVEFTPVTSVVYGGICEGIRDDGNHTEKSCCHDADNDKYFKKQNVVIYNSKPVDCNDNNANVNPGAPEICGNGIDNNCDGKEEMCVDSCWNCVPGPPSCFDGIQNQGEMKIDCGGPCLPCPQQPTCFDGQQNQGESGIDCGGPCSPCIQQPSCFDGQQNQGETGIDCGGPCLIICPQQPNCFDGQQNQGETGIDCGGPCQACTPQPSCFDGQQNQDETGIDCGGVCPSCQQQIGPQILVSNVNSPWDIAVDGNYVYWVENTVPGALRRAQKNLIQQQPHTLNASLLYPTALTIAGGYIYVLETNSAINSDGRISRIPIDGGNPETVISGLQGAQNHLTHDESRLFFVDTPNTSGVLKSVPFGSNMNASILAQNGVKSAITVDNGWIYYWNDLQDIWKVTTQGGANPTKLQSNIPSVSAMAVFDSTLFFTDTLNSGVMSLSTFGGSVSPIASGYSYPSNLAVDTSGVYWTLFSSPGGVFNTSMSGGFVQSYQAQTNSLGLALDSTHVYWAERIILPQGKIIRSAK